MIYDFIIVGAGSAGSVLASRLSADGGVNVALLEAGPDYRSAQAPAAMQSPNPHSVVTEAAYSQYRWDALQARRTRVQEPRTYWRGRGLGGSSAINGQIAIRAVPEDFDAWAAAGCDGWSFADVLPYFSKLETDLRYGQEAHHGDCGPIPIYRAPMSHWGAMDCAVAQGCLDDGYPWAADHNAPGATGVSPYAINSRDGVRVSTNDAYLEPVRGRNNLAVFGDAHVDRVLFDGGRATGVRVRINGTWRDLRARAVILSAGAVHSPAILMRSGVGPASHLRDLGIEVKADRPVGQALQDHPAVFMPLLLKPGAKRAVGARHTNVCVRYSSGLEGAGPNDMMIVALNSMGDSLGAHVGDPDDPQVGMVAVWVNQCFSRGTLRLAAADPDVQPIVDLNMLDHPSDLERMRDGVRRLQVLARNANIQDIGTVDPSFPLAGSDEELDAYALANAGDTQHGCGACPMGRADDPAAVVDSECRVLGIDGLRVIDASIMPQVVRANTHLTTVMIAERMAARRLAG